MGGGMSTTRPAVSLTTNLADASRVEEVRRTRTMLEMGWIVAVIVTILVVRAPGDPRIRLVLLVSLGLGVAGSVWVHAQLADAARYSPARMNVLAILAIVCGQLGICYVGAFSAAPAMLALGLYFFCRPESRASAIAIFVIATGAPAREVGLVLAGVIDDPGFYPVSTSASLASQIAGQFLLQFAYAV